MSDILHTHITSELFFPGVLSRTKLVVLCRIFTTEWHSPLILIFTFFRMYSALFSANISDLKASAVLIRLLKTFYRLVLNVSYNVANNYFSLLAESWLCESPHAIYMQLKIKDNKQSVWWSIFGIFLFSQTVDSSQRIFCQCWINIWIHWHCVIVISLSLNLFNWIANYYFTIVWTVRANGIRSDQWNFLSTVDYCVHFSWYLKELVFLQGQKSEKEQWKLNGKRSRRNP